ncbi:hypothetical protein D3C77_544630 [compost metagenome]
MPMVPLNGALMLFLVFDALSWSTTAWLRRYWAVRRSNSPREMAESPTSWLPRPKSTLARPRSAWAVPSRAVSWSSLSCSSSCPALTGWPESKCRALTMPSTSRLSSTPCSALRLPTAGRRSCHGRCSAKAAATVMGGLGAVNIWICW